MSEYRTDPLFGDLCIVARERAARPRRMRSHEEIESVAGPCPLCPGNEALCPPEIYRIPEGSERWQSRSFANRYPILTLEAEPTFTDVDSEKRREPYSHFPGFGVHEIVVDSPSHNLPLWALEPEQSVAALVLLQNRLRDLYKDQRLQYLQLFKNHGVQSGGSLDHPHFQIVGLPFTPSPVKKLLSRSECRVCAVLKEELKPGEKSKRPERLLSETTRFAAIADYAPTFSYQFSIYPKKHQNGFPDAAMEELEDLSQVLSLVMGRMNRLLGDFGLNMVFYTRPNSIDKAKDSMHWFIRVYPRAARPAGFELSTGIPVVHVAPEDLARSFREKGV